MFDKLDFITEKYDELAQKVSDPEIINNQPVWQKHVKEMGEMEPIVKKYKEYKKAKSDPGCRSDRPHCSDDHLKEKQYRKRPAIVRDKPGQCRDSKKIDLHVDELQREAFPERC